MSRADVVVVGAGVIGLGVAWRAAAAGMEVTVCDPRPARGASWAAAGMLAPVSEARAEETGLACAGRASMERWPAFAAEVEADSGKEVGLRREGSLVVAYDDDDRRAVEELAAVQEGLGMDPLWCGQRRCRELEPALSPRIRGGVEVPGDWSVDTRALLDALLHALVRRGGRLVRSRVSAVVPGAAGGASGAAGVIAGGERIDAGAVVVAAGARSAELDGLPPAARPPVRPVKGEILRLRSDPRAPLLTRTVRASVQGRSVYLVPRRGGEVVVGATMEEAGFDQTVRAGAVSDMLRAAIDLVPGVADLAVGEAVARSRPGTPDNAPVIGETPVPGLLLATGHYRHGVLLAPVTADAMLAVLGGGRLPTAVERFGVERFAGARAGAVRPAQ